ncbi:MAG: hypothetical protein Q8K72_04320, partial [Acidimicrobiales bacterium]|nr:hypothetical protein [Acidimicrobiales bacterium]
LYGSKATILAQRFESFVAPDEHFDLVIGNVPFAKVTPHDPRHNRSRLGLHNYFIVKSLELTRPGGLVAVLTSRYTADARNPAARREIDARADLVGAIRFPARAFMGSAGTEVVVDLLVLRRREANGERRGHEWATTVPAPLDDPDEPLFVNELFATNPTYVLGTLAADRGMYRERELTVESTGPLLPALDQALDTLVADARARGLLFAPGTSEREPAPVTMDEASPALRFAQEGSFLLADGRLRRLENGQVRPHEPRYRSDEAELRRLVVLRDAARAVLGAQVAGDADPDLHELQGGLTAAYDSYRRVHGPLNRFRTGRTGRSDPETGEEIVRRLRPRMGGFRDDPDWPLVAALEVFDDETQQARPSAMFTQRIISPPVAR